MALPKLRQDEMTTRSAAPAPAPEVGAEDEDFAPAPSPVLKLQQRLAKRALAAAAPDAEKWSPRRSLALIVSASAALWLAILMIGTEATKLVA
jgi:hypothetical protein